MHAMADPPRVPTPPGAEPDQQAQQRETFGRVAQAVHGLPPNQQDVLRLKFQHGFAYKQIARITGLSVSNVGYLLHVAVGTLRREFARQGLLDTALGKDGTHASQA